MKPFMSESNSSENICPVATSLHLESWGKCGKIEKHSTLLCQEPQAGIMLSEMATL